MLARLPAWHELRGKVAALDRALYGGLLVVLSLLYAFAELAEEVSDEGQIGFDLGIMLALREPGQPREPVGPRWFDAVWVDITALGSPTVVIIVGAVVVVFLVLVRRWTAAAFVVVALLGAGVLSFALKSVYGRPRPELVYHLVTVSSPSFPSGHSLLAAVAYPTLGSLVAELIPRVQLRLYVVGVALFLMLLVGMSRVYLGVHYPTDVLAGWCVGLGWSIVCWLVLRRLRRAHTPGIEPVEREAS